MPDLTLPLTVAPADLGPATRGVGPPLRPPPPIPAQKIPLSTPPSEVNRAANPPPHARSPSPCSTASRPVARVAQSYKSGQMHSLASPSCTPDDSSISSSAGRLGVAGRTAWERHAVFFPAPRGYPGSFLAFAQMTVSLDGRAWANFDVDELMAPARRRPGQLLSDRMLLLSGRKLPLHPRSPIGNPLSATGPAIIGPSTKPRQRGQHLGQEIRSAPSVGSGSFVPGSGWPRQFLRPAGRVAGQLFRDEDFAAPYCRNNGRSSVPTSRLATALLLQAHDRVSDAETHRRAQRHIAVNAPDFQPLQVGRQQQRLIRLAGPKVVWHAVALMLPADFPDRVLTFTLYHRLSGSFCGANS